MRGQQPIGVASQRSASAEPIQYQHVSSSSSSSNVIRSQGIPIPRISRGAATSIAPPLRLGLRGWYEPRDSQSADTLANASLPPQAASTIPSQHRPHRQHDVLPSTSTSGSGDNNSGILGKRMKQSDVSGSARGWGPRRSFVVSGGCDREVKVWDTETG